ncbi:MAG: FAD-binding domain-containing protein [Myxococcota bacterium]
MECVWLKRDLRVLDHAPLTEAADHGPVLVLYVYEPDVLAVPETDRSHVAFVNQSLREVREALRERGGELVLRTGRMPDVLEALHRAHAFDRLWSHEETGLDVTFARDRAVARWCRDRGVAWEQRTQFGVFRGRSRRDAWSRAWTARMRRPVLPAPERITFAKEAAPGEIQTPEVLGMPDSGRTDVQCGGARAATAVLDDFFAGRGADYAKGMSSPLSAGRVCSRLSPHLAYGTISLRSVLETTVRQADRFDALARAGRLDGRDAEHDPRWPGALESFAKRLRWHCHFIQKLESEPEIEFRNMSRAFDGLRTEDPHAWTGFERDRFDAWQEGRTGFPMVDACMRSLRATGWINFRMRALLMSFASYHLWLHWRPTGQVLARRFLDFEPGIHYAQCQMQAGTTGINANRIYSPEKQVRDQDPEGRFLRRWLPELEGVPNEYLAAPERMPVGVQDAAGCRIGRDYPAPIVDARRAVAEARRRLASVQQSDEARREAGRVYRRHGSRKRPAWQRGHQ